MNRKNFMLQYNLLAAAAIFSCIFLLTLPVITPVCSGLINGMTPMACHYTVRAEFALSLLALLLSISLFALYTREARLITSIALLLIAGIITFLPQPWALGMCKHSSAACHQTFFWTTFGGLMLFIANAWLIWLNRKESRNEQNEFTDSEESLASQTAEPNLDSFYRSRRGHRF